MKDQSGSHTVFDIKGTQTDQQANKHLFAAAAGEKQKIYVYERHNNRCTADGCKDPRINIRMIPLVFEAPTGAAGKAMLQLIKSLHNQHRAYVLPFDDRHETAIFQKNWTHRISTSIQLGTANMLHNIRLGNRAYARISQEQYGERLQEEEKPNTRKMRQIRRMKTQKWKRMIIMKKEK